MRGLQRPGGGRRILGVNALEIPAIDGINDALSEDGGPKVIDAGAGELTVFGN